MINGNGSKKKKRRVVLFLTERGAGLDSLLRRSVEEERSYEIVGALITSPNSQAIPVLEQWGIPWRHHDIHDFYRSHGTRVSDLTLRPDFDWKSLELIAEFQPSLLALYGYIYVLSRVALEAYPWRIINIHDSDLTIMNGDGRPKYRGLHSTREAIRMGESSVRSTVHLVTEELDAGPVLVLSRSYPIHTELVERALELNALDALKAYAYAHREWMIRDAWGTLIDTALELLAQERISIREGRVFIDGRPGPVKADLKTVDLNGNLNPILYESEVTRP